MRRLNRSILVPECWFVQGTGSVLCQFVRLRRLLTRTVLLKRRRVILFAIFYTLAFAQWFFTSSAFLRPSNYSLLMIPLAGDILPWYSPAVTSLLEDYASILLLPLLSSGFYACLLVYAVDVARAWFRLPSNKNQ